MNRVINFISDLFFPNRCPCCNCFIKFDELVCDDCKARLTLTDYCPKCGNSSCICSDDDVKCARSFVAFDYNDTARCGIIAYKSGENRNFLHYMGKSISDIIKNEHITADYVVYAPMTRKSYILRRFNHAKIIARYVAKSANAKRLSIFTLDKSALTQHTLSAQKRRENSENIRIKQFDLSGKTVIFCDDITTTGSTMLRAATLLKQNGAECVLCVFGAKSTYTKGKNNNGSD